MSLSTARPATRDIYLHFPSRLRSVRGVGCVPFDGRLWQSGRGLSHLCLCLIAQKPRVMARNFLLILRKRVVARKFRLVLRKLFRKGLGRPLYLQPMER